MTAPWMAAAAPTLRLLSRMPLSRFGWSRPAVTIRLALLSLALLCGWTSLGNAAIKCVTPIPCKEIWFFNNSDETLYVLIESGPRNIDEWIQAFSGASPDQRNKGAVWMSSKDYRIYINGKTGLLPGHHFKMQVPFFTYLLKFNQVSTGMFENSLIDWWNGGRVKVYDSVVSGKNKEPGGIFKDNYDADVAANRLIDVSKLGIPNNAVVACVEGDCSELNIFGSSNGGLPDSDPMQLTEWTFGSAITGDKTQPYPFIIKNVGYNVSAVDSVYMPVAMEPLNNLLIPYIGSVKPPSDIRQVLVNWLNNNPGWPIYTGFPSDHPKIPEAHTIFFNAFLDNDTINPSSGLTFTNNGKPIIDMINLYLRCKGNSTAPPDSTCGKIYTLVSQLFDPNYKVYAQLACAVMQDPMNPKNVIPFKNTVTWQLRLLYGWVPYNMNPLNRDCDDGNPLVGTVGQDKLVQLAASYRLDPGGLEYNYLSETDKTQWFNPYVELIHDPKYLDMKQYAFSIDDAVGFQSHPGEGLIYAVGGTNGLQNPNELKPNEMVNVAYGNGTSKWQKVGLCRSDYNGNTIDLDPNFPSFDFFPLNIVPQYPCRVIALNENGKSYDFVISQGPPNITIDCSGVIDLTFCMGTKPFAPNLVTFDHVIAPAVNK
jgi:hypothetical protein